MPHHSKTCLNDDIIISNNFNYIIITGTIDNPVSHHAPLVLVSCTPAAWLNSSYEDDGRDPQILYIIVLDPVMIKFSWTWCTKLQSYDLVNNHLQEQEQTEKDLEEFMETFGDEVDNTCRIEIKSSSSNNSFYKPWISDNPRNYNPLQ